VYTLSVTSNHIRDLKIGSPRWGVVVVLITVVGNHSKSISYKGDGTLNMKAHIMHAITMVNRNMLAYAWQREFQPDILCVKKVPTLKCTNNVEKNFFSVCI
jgi:hypothetical protein